MKPLTHPFAKNPHRTLPITKKEPAEYQFRKQSQTLNHSPELFQGRKLGIVWPVKLTPEMSAHLAVKSLACLSVEACILRRLFDKPPECHILAITAPAKPDRLIDGHRFAL